MSVTYHQTQPKTIALNGQDLNSATYQGVQVFLKSSSRLITEFATVQTDESRVPPPYDSNGYNYSAEAPAKNNSVVIPLGDTTGFNAIKFDWDDTGAINTYGTIWGYVPNWNGGNVGICEELKKSGTLVLPFYDGMPENLTVSVYAKSSSSYQGYISKMVLNLRNVMLITT